MSGLPVSNIVKSKDAQHFIGAKEIDATGCLIVPGLIDCHVHVYEHCTQLGVNPDDNCLARGLFS